jgi:hypothetical protein
MPNTAIAEDLVAFRARAREWMAANLEPLDGTDPFMGHAADDAGQVVRAKAIQRKLWDGSSGCRASQRPTSGSPSAKYT